MKCTCNTVQIVGADDITITQGTDFDLSSGVTAYDGNGDAIPFSYFPTEIDKCEVGEQTIRYTANGIGVTLRPIIPCGRNRLKMPSSCDEMDVAIVYRRVTVERMEAPRIYGIYERTISTSTDFDAMSGVYALDGNDNDIDVEYNGRYDLTATGDIATFEADEATGVKSLVVEIEPIQSGSGTPSPSNVRAISGHTSVETSVTGRNLLEVTATSSTQTNNVVVTVQSDGSVKLTGTATAGKDIMLRDSKISLPTGTYRLTGCPSGGSSSTYQLRARVRRSSGTNNYPSDTGSGVGITLNEGDYIDRIYIETENGVTYNHTFYPMLRLATDTDTTYEPYAGTTYDTALGRTVYGGTLDVVSGVLTVTHGYIANYSGQTLPSTWISDRDVYASGTTPTTGAQVVYKLSTPTTYQLTPTEVETLVGTNHVWSDAGDVTVVYDTEIPQGTFKYPVKGTYYINYEAEDECGNKTERIRKITVA